MTSSWKFGDGSGHLDFDISKHDYSSPFDFNFSNHDSKHDDFFKSDMPKVFYIFLVVFVFIIILGICLSCYFQRKQRQTQRELAAQGYTIGVVNVNGQQGFIAVPPQRTVIQVQQPPPEMQTRPGLQSPPPYNPSYSQPPGYTTMPNQQKY